MAEDFEGWTCAPDSEREAFRRMLNIYEDCFDHNDIGMREALDRIRSIAKREYQRICNEERNAT